MHKFLSKSSAHTVDISKQINAWMHGSSSWERLLKEILTADNFAPVDTYIQNPRDFFRPCKIHHSNSQSLIYQLIKFFISENKQISILVREVPYSQTLCSTQSTWCTTSIEEKEKCEVVRAAGITTGIYPLVECRDPSTDTVACLNDINKGRADFIGIDSTYGFIARQ